MAKSFVDGADERAGRILDHVVVGSVGNRAAEVIAARRAPRRGRSLALTRSKWRCADRRPLRVATPSASISSTWSNVRAVEVAVRICAPREREHVLHAHLAFARTVATIC
jgi:hypothetical protein